MNCAKLCFIICFEFSQQGLNLLVEKGVMIATAVLCADIIHKYVVSECKKEDVLLINQSGTSKFLTNIFPRRKKIHLAEYAIQMVIINHKHPVSWSLLQNAYKITASTCNCVQLCPHKTLVEFKLLFIGILGCCTLPSFHMTLLLEKSLGAAVITEPPVQHFYSSFTIVHAVVGQLRWGYSTASFPSIIIACQMQQWR